jgi:hypothetical protein
MRTTFGLRTAPVAVALLLLGAADAAAYRMIQNSSTGRTTTGVRVTCNATGGFTHWTKSAIAYRLNPAGQGGKTGVASAIQAALAAWTNVTPAGYTVSYAGTTTAGFTTDGTNTMLWTTGNGCSGSCLALTALVLTSGQQIVETDVMFNQAYTWNTSGSDHDVQAIAVHEVGHGLGIHHTELTKRNGRPSMYSAYFGTAGRTLEADDRDALNCAASRYPLTQSALAVAEDPARPSPGEVELRSLVRDGRTSLRFALAHPGAVRLEVFDIAGRRLALLVDGERGAGEHEVAWDGVMRDGAARAGVFFARLQTPAGSDRATIVLAR